ncbi:hypothetical protein GUJ93_ZPchr0005g15117 [Zizania palustris]|uniref:tRNA (guanine(26)-N(2))-dimethyltransferase n=1 Tax=Zizania palustris TaxID=103762 RepID=A0A8J5VQR7_ZIZPA|nr:hypothetical protein GUJ93_ZPchr0005g15117 [Zizania palustris]
MASRIRSSRAAVAVCVVALMALLVSLQPAYAARPLRPAGWNNAPTSRARVVVDNKSAPLLLAMLPRAPVPPSGPSGGTNEITHFAFFPPATMATPAAAAAAAALSFPRALSPRLPPRRRRAEPASCAHSERGVSFDPGSAFYRSDSAAGRDLAVLAATLHRRGRRPDPSVPFLCLDAMCGCGVRALRYLEQAGADFVWANDASDALRPVIVNNLSRFERAPNRRWVVSHLDATRLLAERYLRREYFDVIDVDSFGGDAEYIRAAFLALRIRGLLYMTSTDWRSARGYGSRRCLLDLFLHFTHV